MFTISMVCYNLYSYICLQNPGLEADIQSYLVLINYSYIKVLLYMSRIVSIQRVPHLFSVINNISQSIIRV